MTTSNLSHRQHSCFSKKLSLAPHLHLANSAPALERAPGPLLNKGHQLKGTAWSGCDTAHYSLATQSTALAGFHLWNDGIWTWASRSKSLLRILNHEYSSPCNTPVTILPGKQKEGFWNNDCLCTTFIFQHHPSQPCSFQEKIPSPQSHPLSHSDLPHTFLGFGLGFFWVDLNA